jgi:uncharacterized damage-inducible protein DinB
MADRTLTLPPGFDPHTQLATAQVLAFLDDQLQLLEKAVGSLTVTQLEWQPSPGTNTIGMLLAHMAVAECYWLSVAPKEIPLAPDGEQLIERTVGIRMADDGFPLAPDGHHPESLKGKTAPAYFAYLRASRKASHDALGGWRDDELHVLHALRKRSASRHWILYHTLEHTVSHIGQVFALRQMMLRAGVIQDEFRR